MSVLRFFSPRGRIARLPYLKALGIVMLGLGVVHLAMTLVIGERYMTRGDAAILGAYPALAALLVFFLAQQTKRLHDLGFRGWWALPAFLPPLVLLNLIASGEDPKPLWLGLQVMWMIGLSAFVAWAVLAKGSPSQNQFGLAPTANALTPGDFDEPVPQPSSSHYGVAGAAPLATTEAAAPTSSHAPVPVIQRKPLSHLKSLLSPSGRFGRLRFLQHIVLSWTLGFCSYLIFGALITARPSSPGGALAVVGALVVLFLVSLLLWWYSAASAVKRFHDRGYSGWTALVAWLAVALSLASMLSAGFVPLSQGVVLLGLFVGVVASAFFIVVLFFLPGDSGANRFGPAL